METPANLQYTKEHEWVRREGAACVIGITDYAQHELGDVVFVELPQAGRMLKKGESFATLESVKAVSDVYAPISGKVVARNESLSVSPETVNKAPYGDGWLISIEPADAAEAAALMTADAYSQYISGLSK